MLGIAYSNWIESQMKIEFKSVVRENFLAEERQKDFKSEKRISIWITILNLKNNIKLDWIITTNLQMQYFISLFYKM